MSLDVYLTGDPREVECTCSCCDHKHTRTERVEYFSANITHNLGRMAEEAGIYEACWHHDRIGAVKAADLIDLLSTGLAALVADPQRFTKLNPSNGWGDYDGLIRFVDRYLAACREYPHADIHASA